MGEGTNSPVLMILLACVAGSVLLVALGVWLRKSGRLRSRGGALVWAILCLLPLFGAGAIMFTKHSVDLATGKDKPGVDSSRVY